MAKRVNHNGNGHNLKLDPRNARKHSDRNKKLIRQSLAEVGAGRGVLADANGIIRAGNGIFEAWQEQGGKVRVIETDGKTLLVTKRKDLKGKYAIRAAMLDNLAADSSSYDYDAEILAEIAKDDDLIAALAKEDARLAELLRGDAKQETQDPSELVDKAAELQAKWQVQHGDVWTIGRHRLMCGDSTNAADVATLMQVEKAQFTFTDPPYNVGVAYGDATDDNRSKSDFITWCKLWAVHLPKRVLMTVGIKRLCWWDEILGDPQWIIAWVKKNGQGNTTLGGTNKWDAVLCYGVDRDNGTDLVEFNNDYSESIKSKGAHPTAKPVQLWAQLIERFSERAAIVYEPFTGTGTSILACEQTGRIGRGMEIEPRYVSVSLERLSGLGLTPQRIENGKA